MQGTTVDHRWHGIAVNLFALAVQQALILDAELQLRWAVGTLQGGIAPATATAQRGLNLGDALIWRRQRAASREHG